MCSNSFRNNFAISLSMLRMWICFLFVHVPFFSLVRVAWNEKLNFENVSAVFCGWHFKITLLLGGQRRLSVELLFSVTHLFILCRNICARRTTMWVCLIWLIIDIVETERHNEWMHGWMEEGQYETIKGISSTFRYIICSFQFRIHWSESLIG